MTVALVRQGTKYGPEYVKALMGQVDAGQRIVTLTDQADTPGETWSLVHGLPGWWAKLELFAPHTRRLRPFLYIDLDSFVFGRVDRFMGGNEFTMVRDFNDWVPANSSVMWIPKDVDPIWAAFWADPKGNMERFGLIEREQIKGYGDQGFLGKFAEKLWERTDGIVSYKRDGKDEPAGTIMQFHGTPKMPDVKRGWVKDRWQAYAGK